MPSYDPELISTMRAALDDVMTQIPAEQSTLAVKVHLVGIFLHPPPQSGAGLYSFAAVNRSERAAHRACNEVRNIISGYRTERRRPHPGRCGATGPGSRA